MDIPQIISASDAATGEMGQQYLATGKCVAMRRWQEQAGEISETSCRDYETVGYLIRGRMELNINGSTATISAGDSWLVPERAEHRYRVLESIEAIEATSPPARFSQRDE